MSLQSITPDGSIYGETNSQGSASNSLGRALNSTDPSIQELEQTSKLHKAFTLLAWKFSYGDSAYREGLKAKSIYYRQRLQNLRGWEAYDERLAADSVDRQKDLLGLIATFQRANRADCGQRKRFARMVAEMEIKHERQLDELRFEAALLANKERELNATGRRLGLI